MSVEKVKVGNPIRLKLKITDPNVPTKFVRAIVKDQDGVAIAGSPVALTHQGNNVYRNSDLVMPDKPEVVAEYEVFNDAGFTDQDEDLTEPIDVFQKDTILDDLSAAQSVGKEPDFIATTEAEELSATLEEPETLSANIETSEVSATIEEPAELVAEIEDTDLNAETEC